MTIKFIIWGDPKAKRRHRSRIARTKSGKQYNMQYADPKGVQEESFIKLVAAEHRPENLISEAIILTVTFFLPIPRSFSKKKHADAENFDLLPTKKPDLDNLVKTIKDACNKIIWNDDSQVCEIRAKKLYSDNPRSEVYIETLLDHEDYK